MRRYTFVVGLAALMIGVTACESTSVTVTPSDGAGPVERRREPEPAPDPSALEKCKNTRGCALLQFSWDSAFERYYSIIYKGGQGDTTHTIRWASHKDDQGRWKGLFQTAVTVDSGDVVKISGAPIGGGGGLAIASVYYLGKELCNMIPGSHKIGGPAGCTVKIP